MAKTIREYMLSNKIPQKEPRYRCVRYYLVKKHLFF